MRYSIVFLLFLCLAACKEKPADSNVPPPKPAVEVLKTTEAKAQRVAAPKASDEQVGSTVRVRVVCGALPVRQYTGALIHREGLGDAGAIFEQRRCVLANLAGFS